MSNKPKRPKKADPSPANPTEPDLSHIVESLRPNAVPIASIDQDPANVRLHPEKNLSSIRGSLRVYGQRKPIVVNRRTNTVEAGNGTLEAARSLGWTHIAAVFVDDDPAAATGFAIADNRTAELAEWDQENLGKMLTDLAVTDEEMMAMFDDLKAELPVEEPPTAEDGDVPEPPAEPVTKPGDLWLLGEHRLMCGDSTDGGAVAILMNGEKAGLMNTDPPYGVSYANDDRPNPGVAKPRVAKPRVANDELQDDDLQKFLEQVFSNAASAALAQNAAWYLWHAHLTQGFFAAAAAAAAAANVVLHRQIIWVKPVLLLGRGQYHWKHEPCFMGWVEGNQPPDYGEGNGERTQTTIWEIDGVPQAERKEMNHSTPKPVQLFSIPIVKHLKPGEVAYEPFSGSGPQIIAAEQLGRRCFAMELNPGYCDVAVARWEKLTGKKAELERGEK